MRPFAHLRAWLGGYFWKPCPRCGRMFGGYEVGKRGHVGSVHYGHGRNDHVTCSRCPHDYIMHDGMIWQASCRAGPGGVLVPMLLDPIDPVGR